MFGSVGTTPYDLRFCLFGIPVAVTPWFWLAGLITGWHENSEDRISLLFIWIGCLFVSILVHEMGHALTALACGWPPQVYLYGFGGLAVYRPTSGHTTGRSVLISYAVFCLKKKIYGLVYVAASTLIASECPQTLQPLWHIRLLAFFDFMEFINLWWGLVNLLPVLPLDGGRISEALFRRFRPWDGARLAAMLSVIVAGGVAFYCYQHRERYGTYP